MKTAAEAPPAAAAVDSQRSRLSSVTAATKTRGKRSLDLDLDVDRNMDPDVDLDRDSQGQASTTASGSMSSGAVDADAWTRFAAGGGRCSSSSSSSARMRVEPVGGYEGFAEVKWRDLCFSVACLETERNHMDTRADVVPVSTMNSGWSGVGVGVGVGDCSNGGSASSCSTSSVSTSSLVGHMNLIADVAPALSAFVQYDEDFVLDLVGLLASFLSPSMNMNGARMHRRYCCEVQVAALEGIRNIISPELARVAFASCLSADDTQTRPKGEALAFAVPIQKILTSPEGPAPHASKCQSEIKSARCSDRIRNLATQCLEKLLGALLNCPGQADVDFQDVLRSAAAHAARSVHDDEVLDLLHGRLFIMQLVERIHVCKAPAWRPQNSAALLSTVLLLADVLRITSWPVEPQLFVALDTHTVARCAEKSLVPISAIARALSSLFLPHCRQLGAEIIDVLCTVVSDAFALHAQHDADFATAVDATNVVSNLRRARTNAAADVLFGLVCTAVDIVSLSMQSHESDPLSPVSNDQSAATDCCVEDWIAAVIGCCSAIQAVLVTCDVSRCQSTAMEKLRRTLPSLLSHPRASIRSEACRVYASVAFATFGCESTDGSWTNDTCAGPTAAKTANTAQRAAVSCASASFRPSDFFTCPSLVSRLLHILRTDCSTVRRDALWVISNISHCTWSEENRRRSPSSSVPVCQPKLRVCKRSSRDEYDGDHRVVAAAIPSRPSKRKMQDVPAAKRQRRRGEVERRAAIQSLLGQGCVAVLANLLTTQGLHLQEPGLVALRQLLRSCEDLNVDLDAADRKYAENVVRSLSLCSDETVGSIAEQMLQTFFESGTCSHSSKRVM